MINGFLFVDKPKGWTSFDVVNKVRGTIARELGVKPKKVKVGHCGTLDPAATGLLILVIGSATKRAQELTKLDKTYETEAVLGAISTTGDAEGVVTEQSIEREPSLTQVQIVIDRLVGEQEQTPHPFSAVKVDGKKAYDLARKGKSVELEPRKVTIHDIKIDDYAYPSLKFTTKVSSGTYIRSLVEDIGEQLGTGAYVRQLCRTQIQNWDLAKAMTIEDVSYQNIVQNITDDITE